METMHHLCIKLLEPKCATSASRKSNRSKYDSFQDWFDVWNQGTVVGATAEGGTVGGAKIGFVAIGETVAVVGAVEVVDRGEAVAGAAIGVTVGAFTLEGLLRPKYVPLVENL